MMHKRRIMSMFLLLGALALTGCANTSKATLTPGSDLSTIKTVYVVKQAKDKRDIDVLIKNSLEKRGYKVVLGPELSTPYAADAAVTYIDKWMWDITMYMIELTINIRDPKTGFPLASGNSMHTSMTRKSPPEMVEEVIENISKAPKS